MALVQGVREVSARLGDGMESAGPVDREALDRRPAAAVRVRSELPFVARLKIGEPTAQFLFGTVRKRCRFVTGSQLTPPR